MGDGSDDSWGGKNPRRRNLFRAGAAGLSATAVAALPNLASENVDHTKLPYVPRPGRPDFILPLDHTLLNPDGKKEVNASTVNGVYPGPEISVREGQQVQIQLKNYLRDQFTLIHWHGLLVSAVIGGVL